MCSGLIYILYYHYTNLTSISIDNRHGFNKVLKKQLSLRWLVHFQPEAIPQPSGKPAPKY